MATSVNYVTIFSDYDIPLASTKFEGDSETATVYDTVGSMEYTTETKTTTKNKRGLLWKESVRPTKGTNKLSLHMPMEVASKMFDMTQTGYKDGVRVYGINSVHPYFEQNFLLEDEDGNQALVHMPKCKVTDGFARSVEANGDEVAEVEINIDTLPDTNGQMYYDVFQKDYSTGWETLVDSWMSSWSDTLVKTTA